MTKISGIYVEIRGDATQLKKELREARDLVTQQAQGMSNALNNALSPAQLKQSINGLTRDLSTLANASKLTGKEFGLVSADLGKLQRITGISEAEFGKLQSRMMQTSAAKAQEQALLGIAKAAGLTTAEIQKLGAQMNVSQAGIGSVIEKTQGASDAIGGLVSIGRTAAGVFSGMVLAKFAMELAELPGQVIQAGIAFDSLERSMYAVTGSATAAAETLGFIRKEADRLGQNFYNLAPEFKNIAAAARGTAMEGEEVRKLFTAITGASTALGLSMDDTHGTLRALQQMMSKGKIQAEELRGQLGERLPGALKMMADGMGVSTAELNKMMEQGKLLADDALPKLTVQINKMYQAAAEKAALESGQAAVNKLSEAWTELKVNLFDAGAFVWATNNVTGLINAINGVVGAKDAAGRLVDLEAQRRELKRSFGGSIQPDSQAARMMPGYEDFKKQLEDVDRQIRRTKEEIQWMTDPANDGFMAMSTGMERAANRASVYTQEVEKGRAELAKYIQTAREKAKADYENAVRYANSTEEQAKALKVYQDTLAALDKKESKGSDALAKKQAKEYEQMLADGRKAAEALDKYWQDYEDARVKAVVDGVADRASAQEKDLALVTEFSDKYRAIVLGETEFKLDQIRLQGEAYVKAGSDEIAVAQWVAAEKLKVSRDWQDGVKRGLQDYADSATNAAALAENAITNGFQGMEDALVNFVQTGKLEFADLANSIIADLARIAIQQSITGPLASGFGDLIGNLFSGGSAASVMPSGGAGLYYSVGHHDGGIVGSEPSFVRAVNPAIFDNAPRLHSGGIAGDEVPAILKRGEGVFTEGQMRAMGGPAKVEVNIIESQGKGGQIEQREDNGTMILDIFFDQLDARMASNINNGRGATTAAISKTYGLNRSRGSMR